VRRRSIPGPEPQPHLGPRPRLRQFRSSHSALASKDGRPYGNARTAMRQQPRLNHAAGRRLARVRICRPRSHECLPPTADYDPHERTSRRPFDVAGTLVDTAYLHAVGWWEAFRQYRRRVSMPALGRAIPGRVARKRVSLCALSPLLVHCNYAPSH
jgi:Predicted phosphatase/phosphohexomutase